MAFFKLLVQADIAAGRNNDKRLEREIEKAWRLLQGPSEEKIVRCQRHIRADGRRLQCVLEKHHEDDCVFWVRIKVDEQNTLKIRQLSTREALELRKRIGNER